MKPIAAGPLYCIVALAAALGACKPSAPEPETGAVVVPAVPPPPSARTERAEPAAGGAAAAARREFVAAAAEAGLAEIEAARLAAMRTSSAKVKALAAQIEADHGRMHDALQRIARDQGIDVPATVAGDMRAGLDELAAESGGDFDRRYVRDFGVDTHLKAIALFERQASAGADAELRAFAERCLPILREHLAAAQRQQGEPA